MTDQSNVSRVVVQINEDGDVVAMASNVDPNLKVYVVFTKASFDYYVKTFALNQNISKSVHITP